MSKSQPKATLADIAGTLANMADDGGYSSNDPSDLAEDLAAIAPANLEAATLRALLLATLNADCYIGMYLDYTARLARALQFAQQGSHIPWSTPLEKRTW